MQGVFRVLEFANSLLVVDCLLGVLDKVTDLGVGLGGIRRGGRGAGGRAPGRGCRGKREGGFSFDLGFLSIFGLSSKSIFSRTLFVFFLIAWGSLSLGPGPASPRHHPEHLTFILVILLVPLAVPIMFPLFLPLHFLPTVFPLLTYSIFTFLFTFTRRLFIARTLLSVSKIFGFNLTWLLTRLSASLVIQGLFKLALLLRNLFGGVI